MNKLLPKWIANLPASPTRMLWFILAITLCTHLPTGFGSFVADDYMQWAMIKGSSDLVEAGFSKANPKKSFPEKIKDAYHFFSAEEGTLDRYKQYGNVFWWAGDDISMVPFRPLAAITHWIDYTLFSDELWLHQLHSLLYFLLLAVALFKLYQILPVSPTPHAPANQRTSLIIAGLATVLFIVDFSFTRSFAWVVARNSYLACLIGVISIQLYIRWRQERNLIWCCLSMITFCFALLTAEAAISAAAYMGAYVLCMERQPLLKKVFPLLPIIAVIIIWRAAYDAGGFGSLNIGQYVDPGRSPIEFAVNLVSVFPLIAFSQITGLDTLIIYFHPHQQTGLIVAAWAVTLIGLLIIRSLIISSATARFWLIGSMVAAIPGSALISAESRTVSFVAIGFFYLLATLLMNWRKASWPMRWSYRALLGWHLVLPALIAIVLSSGVSGFSQLSDQHESVEKYISSGDTGLVVINPQSSGMQFYLPFEWAFRDLPIPRNMNVLSTGMESLTITRLTERKFLVEAPTGMPIHHQSNIRALGRSTPTFHPQYANLYTQSFFTRPIQRFKAGDQVMNADAMYTIESTDNVGPTRISVAFVGQEHPDKKVWQWYNRATRQYERLPPLLIGESKHIPGPFDR